MKTRDQKRQTSNLKPETLAGWLEYIERVHPSSIAMGLERTQHVARILGLKPEFPVITVGGTNGKGSACAMLEAILHHAGYKAGCYTSPHLLRYNERVRIGCREVSDTMLCSAFAAVDAARGATALTYFEFGTLAAVWLFAREAIDVAILEVGLGGRLDAVNVFDADCSLVLSVDLDHMDYLGDTREAIGFEKAGIFRAGRPAICADARPPQALLGYAKQIGAQLQVIGEDYSYAADRAQWRFRGQRGNKSGLPYPAMRGGYQLANASACIAALEEIREKLPVTINDVRSGLLHAQAAGRFQVLPGRPVVILDVAHNPHAGSALAENLAAMACGGRTLAVFSMLQDKDIEGVIGSVKKHIDCWLVAGIEDKRGATAAQLLAHMQAAGVIKPITACSSITAAYAQACEMAVDNDRILVFGSFYTVAAAMCARQAFNAPDDGSKTLIKTIS